MSRLSLDHKDIELSKAFTRVNEVIINSDIIVSNKEFSSMIKTSLINDDNKFLLDRQIFDIDGLISLMQKESAITTDKYDELVYNLLEFIVEKNGEQYKNDIAHFISGYDKEQINDEAAESIIYDYFYTQLVSRQLFIYLKQDKKNSLASYMMKHLLHHAVERLSSIKNTPPSKEINSFIEDKLIPYLFPACQGKASQYSIYSIHWGLIHTGMIYFDRIGTDYSKMDETDLFNAGVIAYFYLKEGVIPST